MRNTFKNEPPRTNGPRYRKVLSADFIHGLRVHGFRLARNKNVLIFGLGINQGGLGAAKFFAKAGANVRITDLKTRRYLKASLEQLEEFSNISYILGHHRKEDIEWADLIIKNPGVKPGNELMEYAKSLSKEIEMDMGIFLQFISPSQIIGITGTKGKSTTSSLIYEAIKQALSAGVNVFHPGGGSLNRVIFAGNIGKSVLETIPHVKKNTLVVLELSSFQLEAFEKHKVSPKWSVITNISPDHLNYYQTLEGYIDAKKIIAKYQTEDDTLFINKDDKTINNSNFLRGLKSQLVFYSKNDLPKNFKPELKGEHNRSNMAAALAVAREFNLDTVKTLKILASFRGVEFRMQLIKNWRGIKIYNDTAATNPSATIQALKSFPNCILICGGVNKNLPYEELAKAIDRYAKMVFFLEGDATEEIKKNMLRKEIIAGTYNNLNKLLRDIKKGLIKEDESILFSPAAASFNLFQNEFDRGRKFNATVKKVFGK